MSKAVIQGRGGPSDVQWSSTMCSHNEERDAICQGQGFTLYRSMIITIFSHWRVRCERQGETQKIRAKKKICYLSQRKKMFDRKSEKKTQHFQLSAFHNFKVINISQVISNLLHMIGESCRSDSVPFTPSDTLEKMISILYLTAVSQWSNHTFI